MNKYYMVRISAEEENVECFESRMESDSGTFQYFEIEEAVFESENSQLSGR